MLVGAEIVGVVPFPCGFGMADGLLVFCRHVFDEAVLLAGPQRDVGDGLHGAPRLAQEVDLVEMQVLAQGDELVDPGFLCPQFGMAVEVGVAAADLVVRNDLPACVGDSV